MTTDIEPPLYTLAGHAPWREILRHRWSGRRDRALVLRDRSGVHRVLQGRPRHHAGPWSGAQPPCPADNTAPDGGRRPIGLTGYDCAFHVRVGERSAGRRIALPAAYGTEPWEVRVRWWVHDAAQVVRSGTDRGWSVVCDDLNNCLRHLDRAYTEEGHGLDAAGIRHHLTAPRVLDGFGLTYLVVDVRARESDFELRLGQRESDALPGSWTDGHREQYEFCLRAVRSGPASLAALWLLRRPDEVSRVLDWAVGHQGLLREESSWQEEMARMLGTLTEPEKEQLSVVLRDRLAALGRQVPRPAQPSSRGGRSPKDVGRPTEAHPAGARAEANGRPYGGFTGRPQ